LEERGVRAIGMVPEALDRGGQRQGLVTRIARQLDIGLESLPRWVIQAEIVMSRSMRRAWTISSFALPAVTRVCAGCHRAVARPRSAGPRTCALDAQLLRDTQESRQEPIRDSPGRHLVHGPREVQLPFRREEEP
jgi:hypothetical protein